MDGTYKVVKEMHYDAQNKDWSAKWKMVVDTAKRVRRPENSRHADKTKRWRMELAPFATALTGWTESVTS